jgi:hypothetical protein
MRSAEASLTSLILTISQGTSAAQQPEKKTDKDNGKDAAQKGKKMRTRIQAAQPQPPRLVADALAAALGAIPANDWWRTWAANTGRTNMLRMIQNRA